MKVSINKVLIIVALMHSSINASAAAHKCQKPMEHFTFEAADIARCMANMNLDPINSMRRLPCVHPKQQEELPPIPQAAHTENHQLQHNQSTTTIRSPYKDILIVVEQWKPVFKRPHKHFLPQLPLSHCSLLQGSMHRIAHLIKNLKHSFPIKTCVIKPYVQRLFDLVAPLGIIPKTQLLMHNPKALAQQALNVALVFEEHKHTLNHEKATRYAIEIAGWLDKIAFYA